MKDIIHSPIPDGEGYCCEWCGDELPVASVVAANGGKVVEIGLDRRLYIPIDPTVAPTSLKCSNPRAKVLRERFADLSEIGENPTKERGTPSKSDDPVKARQSHSWNAFLSMREATKLR